MIAPRKNTVGTAKACTASQRNVKIGYVLIDIIKIYLCNRSNKYTYTHINYVHVFLNDFSDTDSRET